MNAKPLFLAALFAGASLSANAADNPSLPGCVDLGNDREVVRSGGGGSMLLRDADSHYLLTFRDDCGSLATTRTINIQSEGAGNRLCPDATVVRTKRQDCEVRSIEVLDAQQFAERKRRLR